MLNPSQIQGKPCQLGDFFTVGQTGDMTLVNGTERFGLGIRQKVTEEEIGAAGQWRFGCLFCQPGLLWGEFPAAVR